MRTNIEIDEDLIREALELTGLTTTQDVIHLALEELVRRLKRLQMLQFRGTVKWEGDLDEMR